ACHMLFLFLVVLNLVSGFEALGTLMAVGMMMLPAATARLWTRRLWVMMTLSATIAALSGLGGLLVSFHCRMASGPTIILTCSLFYGVSLLLAPMGLASRLFAPRLTRN
ncbi:metal ABC transporter permease, partial [Komagataeibacter sp. FXV2]|nr:metal ABC transporter permease [Komagataeibacter sp. FXV2]